MRAVQPAGRRPRPAGSADHRRGGGAAQAVARPSSRGPGSSRPSSCAGPSGRGPANVGVALHPRPGGGLRRRPGARSRPRAVDRHPGRSGNAPTRNATGPSPRWSGRASSACWPWPGWSLLRELAIDTITGPKHHTLAFRAGRRRRASAWGAPPGPGAPGSASRGRGPGSPAGGALAGRRGPLRPRRGAGGRGGGHRRLRRGSLVQAPLRRPSARPDGPAARRGHAPTPTCWPTAWSPRTSVDPRRAPLRGGDRAVATPRASSPPPACATPSRRHLPALIDQAVALIVASAAQAAGLARARRARAWPTSPCRRPGATSAPRRSSARRCSALRRPPGRARRSGHLAPDGRHRRRQRPPDPAGPGPRASRPNSYAVGVEPVLHGRRRRAQPAGRGALASAFAPPAARSRPTAWPPSRAACCARPGACCSRASRSPPTPCAARAARPRPERASSAPS